MRRARRPTVLVAIALLAAGLATPAGAQAADTVTVSGTVLRDGQPVAGASVTVTVDGSDVVAAATTDDAGVFSVDIEATVGAQVAAAASGQTFQSEPDAKGCVQFETPTGHARATLDGTPPAPLVVSLDELVTATVCSAPATPRVTPATPRVTPPSTDALVSPPAGSGPGGGLLLVLGALALAGTASLLLASRRR